MVFPGRVTNITIQDWIKSSERRGHTVPPTHGPWGEPRGSQKSEDSWVPDQLLVVGAGRGVSMEG